jgi:hypothetical protein
MLRISATNVFHSGVIPHERQYLSGLLMDNLQLDDVVQSDRLITHGNILDWTRFCARHTFIPSPAYIIMR